jgi:hypothetical protein
MMMGDPMRGLGRCLQGLVQCEAAAPTTHRHAEAAGPLQRVQLAQDAAEGGFQQGVSQTTADVDSGGGCRQRHICGCGQAAATHWWCFSVPSLATVPPHSVKCTPFLMASE